ncbi:thioredoxin domain-containing protein [Seonamhaeicola sp.]|uniref:thioredoxin family protein n=1 Tax=Seonamhaeicola sp. TaxID=1912245 RepID=UPI002612B5BC|nr:thioredoxin domain-containing protein [Seonamhaeicola sp.]
MKKLALSAVLCLALFSTNAQGIKWQKNVDGATFQQVKTLAKAENKKIFLDFYTKWCGPCRSMDMNVFNQKEIGDYYNDRFINFKVDAEVGEGIELAKQYEVRGYPTYIFVDTEGKPLIDAGSSIGRADVESMIAFAKEALGGKVKTWEAYQAEYNAPGKKDPVFLQQYMKARLKFKRMPPSKALLWEWVQALPQETLFKNEQAKNTIKWQASPGNEFYKLLIVNTDKYPELSNKQNAVKFISNILLMASFGRDASVSFEDVKATLKKDFPKYFDMALEYTEIDKMRFDPNTRADYANTYFEFIDREDLGIDLAGMLSVNDTPHLKPEYALRAIARFEEGVNTDPPHFYSVANVAYLLSKGGKQEEAKKFANKFKGLTDTFEGNKKMKWAYETMRTIEQGEVPTHLTR